MIYLSRIICLIVLCTCKLGLCFLDIDEFRELKYGIEIKRKPVLLSHLNQDNVVHLSSKYGQMYQCNLPIRETENPKSGDDLAHQPNITVKSILDDAFSDQCLVHNLGWWTYQVCYKKDVVQYHEDNGITQGSPISLGSYESEKEWNDMDYSRKPNKEEHHAQNYTNGSICELVGKKRQTTVKGTWSEIEQAYYVGHLNLCKRQFVCSDESSNLIISVDEPETCTYSITIGCKELCVHPLFKSNKKEIVKEITCAPAIPKKDYEQYMKREQEHMQKKKGMETEEEKLANSQNLPKSNKVLTGSLNSFASEFTSFLTKQLVSTGDQPKETKRPKEIKQEEPGHDLSNFWKDLGFHPEGPDEPGSPTTKEQTHKQGPAKSSAVVEEGLKDDLGADEVLSDNGMSKGDSMLSTEGQFVKKEVTSTEESISKIKENEKSLLSLKDRVNKINKQAATLIKKDQEKMRIFMKEFSRSKKKIEKQINEFKDLMNNLSLRKSKEHDKNNKERLGKLIKRVDGNIKKYKAKLSLLEAKVQKTIQKSKAFEKTYKDLLQNFPVKYTSKKTDVSGTKKVKSLTEIIRELQTERKTEDTNRIAKSGDQMDLDEESSAKLKDPDQEQSENLDPLLEALRRMLKHATKERRKPYDKKEDKKKEDAKTFVSGNTKGTDQVEEDSPSKSSQGNAREEEEDGEDGLDGKIKVRISRLGNADTKLLEENEKQEELSGVSNTNNRLKEAGKKIEDIIKKKLKKAGVDVGANIKIKIITNEGPLSSLPSNGKTEFLTDETATQFKDLLTNMLGGGAEKIKEEKRQSELEDSYKFVWNQDDDVAHNERTDSEDNDRELFL